MPPTKLIFWEVDVQVDFMLPGGRLYVPGAEKLIPNIRRLVSAALEAGVLIVASGDAHPPGDPEFATFPPHCLRGTPGARILPEGLGEKYQTLPNDASSDLPGHILLSPQIVIEKQTLDVFDNPRAGELVARLGSDAEYVVFGVTTEYCVLRAARGLLARGRAVSVVIDAMEALDAGAGRRSLEELQAKGARLITTADALAMLDALPPRCPTGAPAAPASR